MNNPYIAHNPVGSSEAFVGREDVLHEVLNVLNRPDENALVLYGQRHMGKTSVLQNLSARLPREGPYHLVCFDLQDKATTLSLAQVIEELAACIASKFAWASPPPKGEDAVGKFRDDFLPHLLNNMPADSSLIFLFDECHILDDSGETAVGAAFFPYLGKLLAVDQQRLNFIFVIGCQLEELSNPTFSLFKEFKTHHISLLLREETEKLVRMAERNNTLHWLDEAVELVWTLTGGHPFLTQQLCQEVWKSACQNEPEEPENPPTIGVADVEAAISSTLKSATKLLALWWKTLQPVERIVASALAKPGSDTISQEELEQRLAEPDIYIHALRNVPCVLAEWELITPTSDGGYRFSVELLRRWIIKHKPLNDVWEEVERSEAVVNSLYQAAYGLYLRGELEPAMASLHKAVHLKPNHLRAKLLLAEILLAQSNEAQAPDREDERLALYENVLELIPNHPEAIAGRQRIWKKRGDVALAANQPEEALNAYKKANLQDKIKEAKFDVALREIERLLQRREYHAALTLAKTLHDQYPQEQERLPDLTLLERKTHLESWYQEALEALDRNEREVAQKKLAEVVALEVSYREVTRYLHLAVTGLDAAVLQTTDPEPEAEQQDEDTQQERVDLGHDAGNSKIDPSMFEEFSKRPIREFSEVKISFFEDIFYSIKQGKSCLVIGLPRSGKSQLLYQIYNELSSTGHNFIFIDPALSDNFDRIINWANKKVHSDSRIVFIDEVEPFLNRKGLLLKLKEIKMEHHITIVSASIYSKKDIEYGTNKKNADLFREIFQNEYRLQSWKEEEVYSLCRNLPLIVHKDTIKFVLSLTGGMPEFVRLVLNRMSDEQIKSGQNLEKIKIEEENHKLIDVLLRENYEFNLFWTPLPNHQKQTLMISYLLDEYRKKGPFLRSWLLNTMIDKHFGNELKFARQMSLLDKDNLLNNMILRHWLKHEAENKFKKKESHISEVIQKVVHTNFIDATLMAEYFELQGLPANLTLPNKRQKIITEKVTLVLQQLIGLLLILTILWLTVPALLGVLK